jgi:hypothetical protein
MPAGLVDDRVRLGPRLVASLPLFLLVEFAGLLEAILFRLFFNAACNTESNDGPETWHNVLFVFMVGVLYLSILLIGSQVI